MFDSGESITSKENAGNFDNAPALRYHKHVVISPESVFDHPSYSEDEGFKDDE